MRLRLFALVMALSLVVPANLLQAWVHGYAIYTGLVGNKTYLFNDINSANKVFMARSPHFSSGGFSSHKIALANWYVDANFTGVEHGSGGPVTFTASLEYPAGTCIQAKFLGSTSLTAADFTNSYTDLIAAIVPPETLYWERVWASYSVAGVFTYDPNITIADTANGQATTYGTTGGAGGVVDQTVSCDTVVNTNPNVTWQPVAIIGQTNRPTFGLFGDSRMFGWQDGTPVNSQHNRGEVAPSLCAIYSCFNAGVTSTTVQFWLMGNARQLELATFVSNVVDAFGINDISFSTPPSTPGQLISYQQAFASVINKPTILTTLPTITSSTDGWTSITNQNLAATNSARVSYNTMIRAAKPAGISSVFEIANLTENAVNGGYWNCPTPAAGCSESAVITPDGLHENSFMTNIIMQSGNVHYP
jgi:hypothetical protein